MSPRHRAQRTLELLHLGCRERYPWNSSSHHSSSSAETTSQDQASLRTHATIEITPNIREWTYGDYEGLTSSQIRKSRSERGLDPNWDIWRDGCEGGESAEDVTARCDELIREVRGKWHRDAFGKNAAGKKTDVLIVAHGHILRAFAARWIGKPLEDNPSLILEAGGVGTLR